MYLFLFINQYFLQKYLQYNTNINAGIIKTDITDHHSTIIAIDTNTILNSTDKVLNVMNYNKLNDILTNDIWTDIYCENDINVYVD